MQAGQCFPAISMAVRETMPSGLHAHGPIQMGERALG